MFMCPYNVREGDQTENGDDHFSTKLHVRINYVLTRNYFYYKIICVYMDKVV